MKLLEWFLLLPASEVGQIGLVLAACLVTVAVLAWKHPATVPDAVRRRTVLVTVAISVVASALLTVVALALNR